MRSRGKVSALMALRGKSSSPFLRRRSSPASDGRSSHLSTSGTGAKWQCRPPCAENACSCTSAPWIRRRASGSTGVSCCRTAEAICRSRRISAKRSRANGLRSLSGFMTRRIKASAAAENRAANAAASGTLRRAESGRRYGWRPWCELCSARTDSGAGF